jgi:hypothetical protein
MPSPAQRRTSQPWAHSSRVVTWNHVGVGRSDEAVELRAALRRGLIDSVASSGWREAECTREDRSRLVGLIRPLADGFAATAEVTLTLTIPDDPPVEVVDVRVGVAFEPLRRWWPLLGEQFALSLLEISALRPDSPQADSDDVDEDRARLEVSSKREVVAAVERLAAMIVERAVPYAERYTSHEALLAALDAGDSAQVDLRVPALLSAVGRFDEAAVALDRYEPPATSDVFSRREPRTAYQLRRWINGLGDASMLPDGPPPNGWEDRSRPPSFAETDADVRARREAVEAVRKAGRGHDRDEVRAMLERELAQRGVTRSPLELELTLDHLWDTPAERMRIGVQGLKALGRFGLGVAKVIREGELPDLSRPQWLEPPEPAFYELPRGDRWIRLSLEPGIDERLERIHQAAPPRVMSMAAVSAWLQPEPNGADIAVYIGRDRVGVVPADALAAYQPVMQAATFREELPILAARLTRRTEPPGYLLELALPPS